MTSNLNETHNLLDHDNQDSEEQGARWPLAKSEADTTREDIPQIIQSVQDLTTRLDSEGLDEENKQGDEGDDVLVEDEEQQGLDTLSPKDQPTSSLEDSASIPDDTPSIRESTLSSPRSGTPSTIRSPGQHGSPAGGVHRPFDLRFQSRLSSSPFSPVHPSSSTFLSAHSRHSSLGSIGVQTPSEFDDAAPPWEVIRWTKLKRITGQAFSEIGRRNFGSPTFLAVTEQIVVGTSKGMVLVFDHQQNHKAIIGAGTKAVECGAVTSLAISADHTTIAVGHATGHIFTWELSRPTRPFLHILPIDMSLPQGRRGDGHVAGSAVLHMGFLGYRHTALVSADDKGMAFSHLATRGTGPVGRVVRTTRILGRYPQVVSRSAKPLKKSSVLAFAPLPLGNVEQRTDSLGLVAMLTPYLLVIVSTTPIAQTQHKAARPKEVAAHSAMTAALAWFPAIKTRGRDSETTTTKLVYAWSNILTVLEVHDVPPEGETDKEKGGGTAAPELQFLARSRYQAEEAIVGIQWLSRSVLAVLTITQQLLILEDVSMSVTDSFDLLQKNIYHADLYSQQLRAIIENLDEEDASMHGVVADSFHMSFRAYKGRLFLLGFNDLWWGSLTNWADRLLALMNVGDFIGAIRLATRYFAGQGEKVTIGLPEDDAVRSDLVREKLLEMMSASLKYAFGKNQQAGHELIEKPQMVELADACIKACLAMEDRDFLFSHVFGWYDDHDHGSLFTDVLEPYILDGQISSLPPPALKTLIDHFVSTHTPSALEEIICLLDTSTMDIDQVTNLCKRHNLYDAYIYVWTRALSDFTGPLDILLHLAGESERTRGGGGPGDVLDYDAENAQKMFPYLSFTLTGRIYPTGADMEDSEAVMAKSQIYDYLFSGNPLPNGVDHPPGPRTLARRTLGSFANLNRILNFDTAGFMAALNEAFEDSFLNVADDEALDEPDSQQQPRQPPISPVRTYTRQYIVRVLLEVMSTGFPPEDTIYLDIFIARNLAKYPQYMLLSGTVLQQILTRLCQYPDTELREDAQLSVEYLLSIYQPPNMLSFVPMLQEARFYRVLKSVFRQEHQYAQVIQTFFLDAEDQEGVFASLVDFLRPSSSLSGQQRKEVLDVVQAHALELTSIDIRKTAVTIDTVAPDLHRLFLRGLDEDPFEQYDYLQALLEPSDVFGPHKAHDSDITERYVRLMCQYDPAHVKEYIENVKDGNIRLQEVLPTLESSGIVDAAVILQVRHGQVQEAMDRLTKHLSDLGSALKAIVASEVTSGSDMAPLRESVTELLESIDRYTHVGIWLCQGQLKNGPRSKPVAKSPKRSATIWQPLGLEERLWLELIVCVVSITRELSSGYRAATESASDHHQLTKECLLALRNTIQQVFTTLLASTSAAQDGAPGQDLMFLRILRAFLSHAAEASPSLSELRNVIATIFSAYAHEESLLALSNSMLDKDVFVHIDTVSKLRQQGWRPRGQVCEVCRRRVWGPGIGHQIWDEWQNKEKTRLDRRHRREQQELIGDDDDDLTRAKGKATADVTQPPWGEGEQARTRERGARNLGPVVVFSCRHLYHQSCLGTSGDAPETGLETNTPLPESAAMVCPACA